MDTQTRFTTSSSTGSASNYYRNYGNHNYYYQLNHYDYYYSAYCEPIVATIVDILIFTIQFIRILSQILFFLAFISIEVLIFVFGLVWDITAGVSDGVDWVVEGLVLGGSWINQRWILKSKSDSDSDVKDGSANWQQVQDDVRVPSTEGLDQKIKPNSGMVTVVKRGEVFQKEHEEILCRLSRLDNLRVDHRLEQESIKLKVT